MQPQDKVRRMRRIGDRETGRRERRRERQQRSGRPRGAPENFPIDQNRRQPLWLVT